MALARAQASREARGTREHERGAGAAASESTRAVEPCGSGGGGEPRQAWGRYLGGGGAEWAVYMLCRLERGRNDRPCSECSPRRGRLGAPGFSSHASPRRLWAAVTLLLQLQWPVGVSPQLAGLQRRLHAVSPGLPPLWQVSAALAVVTALWAAGPVTKTLLVAGMLTQQQHREWNPLTSTPTDLRQRAQMPQRG